jgi:Fibronectin type III domain
MSDVIAACLATPSLTNLQKRKQALVANLACNSFLSLCTPPPGQVVGLSAMSGNAQVSLSWTAVTAIPPVTDYLVEYKASASSTWLLFMDNVSSSTTAIVTGLTNNTAYDFQVSAINSAGMGIVSATASATPAAPPGQVTDLSATAENGQTSLSWTAVTAIPSVTDYLVEYKESASPTWLTFSDGMSTSTSAVVTDLTNNTAYNFRISAVNSVGIGTASATVSATPGEPPGQVTNLITTAGNGQITLSWTAVTASPSVTDYLVEYKESASPTWLTFPEGTSTSPSAMVQGLTNNTAYNFRVSAINSIGVGTVSATASAAPFMPIPTLFTFRYTAKNTAGNGTVPANNTAMSSWSNLGSLGTGRNGAQAIVNFRPRYQTSVFGSSPGIFFDGIDDSFALGSDSPLSGFTIVAFFKTEVLNIDGSILASRGNNTGISQVMRYDSVSNPAVFRAHNGSTITATTTASTEPFVVIYRRAGTTTAMTIRVNGVNQSTSGALISGTTLLLGQIGALGGYSGAGARTTFFRGWIGEIIIYASTISDSNCVTIENYFSSQWV